jgi:ABC transporter DrrB family efflux protein
MLVVPMLQTLIFGFAINTHVEHIPLVVFDLDGRQPAAELAERFLNTGKFVLAERVRSEESFERALRSGQAKAGLRVPPDYSDRVRAGQPVQFQVLIDGSDSLVAVNALGAANQLGLNLSLRALLARQAGIAGSIPDMESNLMVDTRCRLLYNPTMESARFFVPALVGVILQLVTILMTSFAIVREREMGTLEQLFVTPVGRASLVFGKLLPYAALSLTETLLVMSVMVYVFGVPITGSLALLLPLVGLFLVCSLGMGLAISTAARTQTAALQFVFAIMLPSVLLSGFMFPRAEMPFPIYVVSFLIPVTYFIEILRGVILRGADFWDVGTSVLGLSVICVVVLTLSVTRFRKTLG